MDMWYRNQLINIDRLHPWRLTLKLMDYRSTVRCTPKTRGLYAVFAETER